MKHFAILFFCIFLWSIFACNGTDQTLQEQLTGEWQDTATYTLTNLELDTSSFAPVINQTVIFRDAIYHLNEDGTYTYEQIAENSFLGNYSERGTWTADEALHQVLFSVQSRSLTLLPSPDSTNISYTWEIENINTETLKVNSVYHNTLGPNGTPEPQAYPRVFRKL